MPIFQYSGTDPSGKTERGMVHGSSLESVAKKLEERGLRVEQIGVADTNDPLNEARSREEPRQSALNQQLEIGSKVRLEDLQFFFMQLGTMLNAGITGADAMNTLGNQSASPRLRRVLHETRDLAIAGKPLSEGFARHPEVFSPLMMAMINAGERGGFLPEQCKHMSEYLRRDIELRNLIRKETAYPKIVVASSILIIFAANTIIEAYGRPGAQKLASPLTSAANWIVIGPIVALIVYYFQVVKKRPEAQYNWDKRILQVPYIGATSHGFAMAKFGRSFGALYRAGVPVGEALKLAADSCGNMYVREQIYPAAVAIDGGEGLTNAFARTGVFSQMVLDMVRTGEVTGEVDQMLIKVSEYYEEEGAVRAKQAAIVLGVVVFIAVAIYVLFVLIKFYTEYFGGMTSGV